MTAALLCALATNCARPQATTFEWVGQDTMTGRQVNLRAGPMPSGDSFSGFYRTTLMGDVNLQQTGDAVIGDYEYERGSCHVLGHLEGQAQGNLFRFNWREDKRACGFQSPVIGRGFMLLEQTQEGGMARSHIYGEIGLQAADRGDGTVLGVKVPGREPVLRSQGSSGGEGLGEGTGLPDPNAAPSGTEGSSGSGTGGGL